MCREKWKHSPIGVASTLLSLSELWGKRWVSFCSLEAKAISWGSSRVHTDYGSPPVCVHGLNAASLNRSVSSWLQVKLIKKKNTPIQNQSLCFLSTRWRTEQRGAAGRGGRGPVRLRYQQLNTLSAPPHTLPPFLSSSSSLALSPSRVVELTSLFFSPFLFLY